MRAALLYALNKLQFFENIIDWRRVQCRNNYFVTQFCLFPQNNNLLFKFFSLF